MSFDSDPLPFVIELLEPHAAAPTAKVHTIAAPRSRVRVTVGSNTKARSARDSRTARGRSPRRRSPTEAAAARAPPDRRPALRRPTRRMPTGDTDTTAGRVGLHRG